MPVDPVLPEPPDLTRRDLLARAGQAVLWSGVSAAAVSACGGAVTRSSARPAPRHTTRMPPVGKAATYHSRPDLRPPQIHVATRPAATSGDLGPDGAAVIVTDAHAGPGQQGPMMIDRQGRLVWFKPLSDHASTRLRAFNVRVQKYRGQPVLTWWQGAIVGAHGSGHYELVDGHYRTVAQVHGADGLTGDLHEFLLTSQNTALFTCYGAAEGEIPRHSGTGTRRGAYWFGAVQEVDIATGRLLFQWRCDQHVPFSASYHGPPPADPRSQWDYFHINSIAVDPVDNNLWISSRNTWTIYKVDRRTGQVIWRLGGRENEFTMGPGTHFAFQHHVVPHPGGHVTIFDNEGGPPNEASQSRGLVLAVDEQRRKVSLVRQYHHRPAVLSPALGSVQTLTDDGAFVGWGDSSWFTEYDRSGHVVLDGRLAPGTLSYRAFEVQWLGQPPTRPAIALSRSRGHAVLHVSWNGSTEHRHWQVLGGAAAGQLAPLKVAAADQFETAITVQRPPAWLAVEALDAAGNTLGRSKAVSVASAPPAA